MAINENISLVISKIDALKDEMREMKYELKNELKNDIHDLRQEMNSRFSTVENRLTAVESIIETKLEVDNRLAAVETKLGMRNELQSELRNRTVEYGFKAGWLILATIVSIVLLCFHVRP